MKIKILVVLLLIYTHAWGFLLCLILFHLNWIFVYAGFVKGLGQLVRFRIRFRDTFLQQFPDLPRKKSQIAVDESWENDIQLLLFYPYLLLQFVFDFTKSGLAPLVFRDHSLVVEPSTGKGVEVVARIDWKIHSCFHLLGSSHTSLRQSLHGNLSSAISYLCLTHLLCCSSSWLGTRYSSSWLGTRCSCSWLGTRCSSSRYVLLRHIHHQYSSTRTPLWSPLPSAHHLTWCYSYCPYCHSCVLESIFGLPVLRHHSLWLTWSSNSTLAKWCSSLALGTQQTEFSEGPIEMQCVILPNFSLHKETNGPEFFINGHIEC